MAIAGQKQLHPTRNAKSKAKTLCKCLRCDKPTREVHDGETLLICGDEACNLKCDVCTNRPTSECKFRTKIASVVKDEVREGVLV